MFDAYKIKGIVEERKLHSGKNFYTIETKNSPINEELLNSSWVDQSKSKIKRKMFY